MKRSAYVLAFVAIGAAIAVTAMSKDPAPERVAQAAPATAAAAVPAATKSAPDNPGF